MDNGDVVMFHIGRCGSTVLCNLLNQNPSVQSEGEVFHKLMDKENKENLNINELLREVKSRKVKSIQLFEIKFLESQHLSLFNINIHEMIRILISHGFTRFIVLERKNYLNRMISHCIAQKTNIYHLNKENLPTMQQLYLNKDQIELGIETKSLFDWFSIFEESYMKLRDELKIHQNVEVIYESDIENDPIVGYLKICDFLNIKPVKVTICYRKLNPFSFSETLINYNEIKTSFLNTKYSWMIS